MLSNFLFVDLQYQILSIDSRQNKQTLQQMIWIGLTHRRWKQKLVWETYAYRDVLSLLIYLSIRLLRTLRTEKNVKFPLFN